MEGEKQQKFIAFITDVALAMQKNGIVDMVCIFGMDGDIRNTYIPLSPDGEDNLYCNVSDGINQWLQAVGHEKSGEPGFAGTITVNPISTP